MNLTNPKVTVRMSAYNHEAYVEEAILSILNQTFQDFELIVIDDGSKDSTPKIIERLSQEHGFYYERQENMGVVRTINKITPMARGEYLTGCASDDFWPSTRLEEQVAALDASPESALVHGIPAIVDGSGKVIADARYELEHMLDGREAFRDMVWRRKKFQTTTVMIRLSVCRELGAYDETIAVEDIDWMLRVTQRYPVKAVGKIWSYYRKHGENWTMTAGGAKKLIRSESQAASKLPFTVGVIFRFTGVPIWFLIARRSKLTSRYAYLFLLPLYFWNKSFLTNFLAVLVGERAFRKLRKMA
ncbi:glycosyltransferase [Akkermansiaceae bacterium]|nr:glycosyltransferase [Akkermansiaceae bacterium]